MKQLKFFSVFSFGLFFECNLRYVHCYVQRGNNLKPIIMSFPMEMFVHFGPHPGDVCFHEEHLFGNALLFHNPATQLRWIDQSEAIQQVHVRTGQQASYSWCQLFHDYSVHDHVDLQVPH